MMLTRETVISRAFPGIFITKARFESGCCIVATRVERGKLP
jgi:hypothetical protein